MFSVQQKRDISDAVQRLLRSTMHPELPTTGEISFSLNVAGAEDWNYAVIKNNGAVGDPGVNPHNELMASLPEEKAQSVPYMPDPRNTPDEFIQEMLKQQISALTQRIYKAEAIIVDYNKRLGRLEDRDTIKDQLYSEQGNQVITLQEDNKSLHTRINSLETAIRQLNSPLVDGDG